MSVNIVLNCQELNYPGLNYPRLNCSKRCGLGLNCQRRNCLDRNCLGFLRGEIVQGGIDRVEFLRGNCPGLNWPSSDLNMSQIFETLHLKFSLHFLLHPGLGVNIALNSQGLNSPRLNCPGLNSTGRGCPV